MGKVYVFDHPLIQHKVSLMRMKETSVKDFRQLAKEGTEPVRTSVPSSSLSTRRSGELGPMAVGPM